MDELERRIRDVRPLSGNRSLPLTDRAKRELAELVMAEPDAVYALASPEVRTRQRRFRFGRPAFASIAAGLATVALAVVWSTTPTPVYAATPPLLEFEPINDTASEILTDLSERTCDGPQEPVDPDADVVIVTHQWNLVIEEDENGAVLPAVISPKIVTATIHPDRSAEIVIVAGEATGPGGIPLADQAPPGVVLGESTFGPGEFDVYGDAAFPDDPEGVPGFFMEGVGLDVEVNAAQALSEIGILLSVRELDCTELSAALGFLAGVPGIDVSGTTTDRLGREAIAFSADRPAGFLEDYRDYLLLDPSSGRVLASETVYVGSDRTDIPSPATTSYTAWK